ncbi:MAG TPA: hypothetical protein VFS00_05170, partial [Polyangiaceae bacterium]|nr:hypothetical protein [Polyangiaceae bacterium]
GAGAAGAGGGGAGAGGEGGLAQLYRAAVADAEVAEASEIVTTLVAITPQNAALTFDAEGRVLVVTWTSFTGYDDKVGQPTDLGVDVFVSVAPEVKTFCTAAGLSGEALSLRLEQKLGLPPGNGKDRMVELWAPTSALFRPSPDPEINDSVAELDFPAGTPQPHIDWINTLKAESYGQDGYPWTRLGYTYDWAPDAPSEVGLSEFVIAKGSTVVVNSVTATGDYCK